MQTVDVLEPNKSQIDTVPLDIVFAEDQFLSRLMRIRIAKVELRSVDEQLDGLGTLSGGDGTEERDRLDLDRLSELMRCDGMTDQRSDPSTKLVL